MSATAVWMFLGVKLVFVMWDVAVVSGLSWVHVFVHRLQNLINKPDELNNCNKVKQTPALIKPVGCVLNYS